MTRNQIILLCIALILLCTACSSSEQQYQFPIKTEDIEKALADQKLMWSVDNVEYKDSQIVLTLRSNDGVVFGVGSNVYETGKILNITWSLPLEFTDEQFNEFYRKDLSELFDLSCILYGNSKELKKGLKEFLNYYERSEENFEGGIYWAKRIGDDHLQIDIKTTSNSQDKRNRLGTLIVMYSRAYEQYLRSLSEGWKKTAQINSIEIRNSSVIGIKKFDSSISEGGLYSEHFVIQGHLEDINEIKTVPELLKNTISSQFLKPNRDKYLSAKLVDDTGSVDVFLQATSLNANELSMERNHNVVLLYYEHNPFFVVRFSPLS